MLCTVNGRLLLFRGSTQVFLAARCNVGRGGTKLHKVVGVQAGSVRNYSSADLTNVPYAAIHQAEGFFLAVHNYLHLPWWSTILISTIFLRSLITLPLALHQSKNIAKMELLMPTLREYQEAVKHNVVGKCRRENLPLEVANKRMKKEARKVAKELYAQEGFHPYKVAILPWVQLPMWLALSVALRNMTGMFPRLTPPPGVPESLAEGGVLWFQNLTVPDPYCVLPILLAASNLLNIEVTYQPWPGSLVPTQLLDKGTRPTNLVGIQIIMWLCISCRVISQTLIYRQMHSLKRKSPSRTQRIMTNSFRVLSLGMGYVGSQMPAAMTLYWATSSCYGLTQNVLFKLPKIRRRLFIPKTPSESKHPFRDLAAIVREKGKAFMRLQRDNLQRKQ